MFRRRGGVIGTKRNSVTGGGIWSLVDQQQEQGANTWGPQNGLTAPSAATSAAALKASFPAYGNGTYWILINGVARQVYCDMTNDGGGWMLYSSFGSGNPLDATTAPALSGNRLTLGTLGTNGWTYATSDGSPFYYMDGAANNSGYFINEADNTSWFAFFASSTPPYGFLYLNTFSVTTPTVTQMRLRFGDPTNNGSTGNEVYTNGVLRVTNTSKVQNSVISYTQNTSSGANSMYIRELSIAGISWLYVR